MKKVLTAAVAALFGTSLIAGAATADPVTYTPGKLAQDIEIDLNGDGKTNAADFTPKTLSDLTGPYTTPKTFAPGQNKPE